MSEKITSDSIKEKFTELAAMNAAMMQVIFRDDNELPIGAAIFVLGPVETDEILAAVKKVEATWTELTEPLASPHPGPLPIAPPTPQRGEGEIVPALEPFMFTELRHWLDRQVITSETIGDIRRRLFVPWDSKWNGIVRDETAARENKQPAIVIV